MSKVKSFMAFDIISRTYFNSYHLGNQCPNLKVILLHPNTCKCKVGLPYFVNEYFPVKLYVIQSVTSVVYESNYVEEGE